jgi:DNA-binding NarL/FixJ family response regulator
VACILNSETDNLQRIPPNEKKSQFIMTIKVLLVDDSWEVREKLRALLLLAPDIELIGEAADGKEALKMLERLSTDVVVLDLNLPEISGIETARRIHLNHPNINMVIISMQSDPHYVKESFRAGVMAYLLKDCAFEELVEAVHIVATGVSYVSPEIEIGIP